MFFLDNYYEENLLNLFIGEIVINTLMIEQIGRNSDPVLGILLLIRSHCLERLLRDATFLDAFVKT